MQPYDQRRVATGIILATSSEIHLAYRLKKAYPDGPHLGSTDIGKTREMFVTTVDSLGRVLKDEGLRYRVAVESSARAVSDVRGIIFKTTRRTHIIAVRISPYLVRINEEPVFVGYSDGTADLLDLILEHCELAIETEFTKPSLFHRR